MTGLTESDRTIWLGDAVIELTEEELRLGAVSYIYKPHPRAPIEQRLATPEEVLQARCPDIMFQVSEGGYASMCARAIRLRTLRALGRGGLF